MPRRIAEYRLLDESLRVYLGELDQFGDDGWPKYKELFAFLRERLDWSGSEREYKLLKRHGTAPARLVEGLFEYLCANSRRRVDAWMSRAGPRGLEPPGPQLLLEQFSSLCDESQVRTDWRRGGWRGLSAMFAASLIGQEERYLCRSSNEVRSLVRWAMADVGRALAGDPLGLRGDPEAECLALAEKQMKRSLAHFQEQAIGWWDACPWTVLKAIYGDEQVGGSIMLPLTPEAYRQLRQGDISDLDLTPGHLQFPSRWMLGEGLINSFPNPTGARLGWVTARQVTTIIYQVARMSYASDPVAGAGRPIEVLCVGGTPDVCQRLLRHGYLPVGPLKGFDVELYEQILPAPESGGWLPTSAAQAYSGVIAACHSRIRNDDES